MKRILKILILAVEIICINLSVFADTGNEILDKTKTTARPRIIANQDTINVAISNIASDTTVTQWYETIKKADAILDRELIKDGMDSDSGVSYEARQLKSRLLTLGLVYFKTDNEIYADRACSEIGAACNIDGWDRGSFLVVGEMAFSLALGYDWFYDALSDKSLLSLVEETLMTEAIEPYVMKASAGVQWSALASNWNIVINGEIMSAVSTARDVYFKANNQFTMTLDVVEKASE